ncbi:MAG: DUF11 domain-containing protein [Clostridium sp.]
MATLNYAKPSSGKLASAIGWINFAGRTVSQSTPTTIVSLTVPGGATLSFSLRGTGTGSLTGTAIPTWSGSAMGNLGYTNIAGQCALYGANVNVNVFIENIIFKDRYGNTIPNFQFYFTDAEATLSSSGEKLTFYSDKVIHQVDHYPANYPCPGYTGEGTTQIQMGGFACTGSAYNSRIFQVIDPTSVVANLYTVGGGEAMALGLSIQQMSTEKIVNGRIDVSDQFALQLDNLTQSITLTTITTGISNGLQNQILESYGQIDDIYTVNESMAPGSLSSLSQYIQTISIVNTSGGSIPTGVTLGSTIPLNTGDFLVVKIINTPNVPYINPIKQVDKNRTFQGNILNYTVILSNTSPNKATSVIWNDTLPNGTSFIANSVLINGVSSSETLPNINIGTIPENSVTTLTFQVLVNTSIPKTTPISNSGTIKYSYPLVGSIPNLSFRSNTVQTIIDDNASIIGTKAVNKSTAKFGDILTYTLVYLNTGVLTANNITLIDTIPSNVTFIDNSFKVNGVSYIGGNPNPPGITIPNTIAQGGRITATFNVLVNTLVNPDTIVNIGYINYGFSVGTVNYTTATITNKVETLVKYVDVSIIKGVDKYYSYPGDTITYQIVIKTVGNIEAINTYLYDTIPSGTTFVPNSVIIDGVNTPDNPKTGINIGTVQGLYTKTITFMVTVN